MTAIRKIFLLFILGFALHQTAISGDFPLDTIYYTGPIDNRVNFVFIGDGYQASELAKYIQDVKNANTYFFKIKPLTDYKNYFNVFAISVPSKESGASHPRTAGDCPSEESHPKLTVNNYFGSTFDGSGVHRGLVVTKYDSVYKVLQRNFPAYDQAFVLVNTSYYGGTGGTFPTSSTNSSAPEIIMHEFAHSFAKLSDEYGGDCSYKSLIGPNVTQSTTYSAIPWNIWVDQATPVPTPTDAKYQKIPGLFLGAYYCDTQWYRPQYSCKMRSLGAEYCAVCNQTLVERIHELVSPVDSYTPVSLNLSVQDTVLSFNLKTLKPIPNTLLVNWTIDDKPAGNADSLRLDTKALNNNFYKIIATVKDTTPYSRDAKLIVQHIKSIQWVVFKGPAGVNIGSEATDAVISIYPNPFAEQITVSLKTTAESQARIELTDLNGKIVYQGENQFLGIGDNKMELNLSKSNLTAGTYIMLLNINGSTIAKEIIKIGK